MGAFLTRRIGPLPVFVWFVVFIIGMVIFLKWRSSKSPTKSAVSSDASSSPNLTTQSSLAQPYYTDVYLNVAQPTTATEAGPAGPVGPAGPAGPQGTPANPAASAPPPATTPAATTWTAATNPYVNANSTVSVGKGANLYSVADSVGLTGPAGHALFASLNPSIWKSNTLWPSLSAPTAKKGMSYKIK